MSIEPSDRAGVRFEDLPEQTWPRQEIIDGSLHVTPLAGVEHQVITTRLVTALGRVVPGHLEVLAGVNVLRRRETDRLLIPDVAVIETSAISQDTSVRPEDVFLVAEVISPSSRASDMHLKQQLYAEWGIGSYWVLDPRTQEIHEFGERDSSSCWLGDVDLKNLWPES